MKLYIAKLFVLCAVLHFSSGVDQYDEELKGTNALVQQAAADGKTLT